MIAPCLSNPIRLMNGTVINISADETAPEISTNVTTTRFMNTLLAANTRGEAAPCRHSFG